MAKAGMLVPNPTFPQFSPSAHPEYQDLANSCLRRDPHLRPSFVEISSRLADFFNRGKRAAGSGAYVPTWPPTGPSSGGPALPAPPFLDGASGATATATADDPDCAATAAVTVVVDDGIAASGLISAATSGVHWLPSAMSVSDAGPWGHCESRNILASCLLSSSQPTST